MIDQRTLEDWLNSANARYRAEEIPPRQRPFRALSDFSRDFKCSFTLDSPIAKSIIDWFYKHSAPGSHAIGSMFTGAFYFDAYFWPMHIPIGYGTFSINAFDCLETMPEAVKEHLAKNQQDSTNLALYWVDCCDYAYGFDELHKANKLSSKALVFLNNGDRELRGAVSQLLSSRPNTKAILALRMACEIFLKALLIQEKNLTDSQLKKISHKIKDIAADCHSATGIPEFDAIATAASVFPDVSERYDGDEWKLSEVWNALFIAQVAATSVVRHYTNRDMRSQALPSKGG